MKLKYLILSIPNFLFSLVFYLISNQLIFFTYDENAVFLDSCNKLNLWAFLVSFVCFILGILDFILVWFSQDKIVPHIQVSCMSIASLIPMSFAYFHPYIFNCSMDLVVCSMAYIVYTAFSIIFFFTPFLNKELNESKPESQPQPETEHKQESESESKPI